ncbi:MAG: hypothetical protein K8S98_05690 [Planctomycetes bacterium]|nr:hypothetical protein [Planctomycetota bacterium]
MTSPAAQTRNGRLGWIAVLVCVAVVSTVARVANHRRVEIPGRPGWSTGDPDSHHLMHRVEGVLRDGFPLPEFDPGLDFPRGSAIPGAPYYPTIVAAALRPFAPSDAEERHVWLEMRMASLAAIFGVVTSLSIAWIGRVLAGLRAGLSAGLIHALCPAAIGFSNVGNGDYHAWVSWLVVLALGGSVWALKRGVIESGRRALPCGVAVGAAFGLALGSWPATMIDVVVVELVLGVLIVVAARRPLAGLATFGLALHVGALVVALSAIVASPWQAEHPWIVVNLSWFHAAFLVVGAGVFVPLFCLREKGVAARVYPAVVAVGLGLGVLWIAYGGGSLASGVRDGFAWASRGDAFMAGVRESQPLFGAKALLSPWTYLGFALAVAPVAWLFALMRVVRRGELELLPLVVLAPIAFVLAATQMRFAGAFVAPMALLVAVAAAPLLARLAFAGFALALLAPFALEWSGTSSTFRRLTQNSEAPRESAARRGARECAEWLRHAAPNEREHSVLASWFQGHTLQWAADKAVVASNYGAYVGVEGFRDPARVFLAPDLASATPILDAHRVRWILATSDLADDFEAMCAEVEADGSVALPRFAQDPSRHDGAVWFRGLGQRLLLGGALPAEIRANERPLERLRLVFVSTLRDRRRSERGETPAPAAYLWERVAGCTLVASGSPGETFEVRVDVAFPSADWRIAWSDRAIVDASGRATLVVPYATLAPNGLGVAQPGARWSLGSRSGALTLSADDVEHGATHSLP